MNKGYLKYALIAVYIALLVFFGFYRDFLFVNINALIKSYEYNIPYQIPESLSFLQNESYSFLIKFKWGLTLVFILIYWLITIAFINSIFKSKQLIKYTTIAYCTILIISISLYFTGKIAGNYEYKFYLFSRYLAGILQSPLMLMILLLAFKLYPSNLAKKKT